jgi:hypothetical protein
VYRCVRRNSSRLALITATGLYLAFALTNLSLPGPNYDEVADAIPALELLRGEVPASALKHIVVLGQPLPVMMSHYIGPTSTYISLIGFLIFGASVESLRITQTLLGLVTLFLTWRLAQTWFNEQTANAAVLLAATAPAFVWWHRAGAFFAAPILPISLGMLLALSDWWRSRRVASLISACLLFGLGCTTKLLFIWWLVPLGGIALFGVGIRRIRERLPSQLSLALAGIACLVGLSPLLIHNIPNLDTLKFIAQNLTRSQLYGHNNLDFFNNLRFQTEQFFCLISGDTLEFNAPVPLPLTGFALLASTAYAITLLRRNDASARLPRAFLFVSILTVIPLATFSVSSIGGRHLFILLPIAVVFLASVLVESAQRLPAQLRYAVPASLLGALVLNNVAANAMIWHFFAQSGGHGLWSDAINRAAEVLATTFANRPIIAMDWGFERSIALLTKGQIRLREAYEYTQSPSARFAELSEVLLREPANVYLFHAPRVTAFSNHWPIFQRTALKMRRQLVQTHVISERDGSPHTLIYVAQMMKPTFDLPALHNPRHAWFGNDLELLGGEVNYDPSLREVSVMLYWRAHSNELSDDTVLLHIVNQTTGEVVAIGDAKPSYGHYPFSRWQAGEVVADPRWVTLPANLPAGIYQVRVGVYDTLTGQRRAIADPLQDAAGDSLMLQTFELTSQ